MKNTVFYLILLLPLTSFAQNFHGMDEAEIENLFQDMEKQFESCMENVDEGKMNEFEQRSQAFENEVKALCAAGKRDEAEKKAVSFGKEIASDPTMQQIQKCNKMMDSVLSKLDYNMKDVAIEDRHVCD
jgi:uncharacterized protein YbaA (DUF1428 family)